jgi:RecB family exonuclease
MRSKFSKKERPTPKIKYPTYWSFSRWEVANDCLFKYYCQFLLKLPQPTSFAMERGGRTHRLGENYIDDKTKRVPSAYKEFADEMRAIKKAGAVAEPNYAFTKAWALTSPTDWVNCWLRIKIDAEIAEADEVTVIDYKTGKPYEAKHKVQREIYGVGVYVKYKVPLVTAEHWYLDSGELATTIFHEQELKELKKKWTARGNELIKRRRFPAQPDVFTCKYCPFRSDKQLGNGAPGPCDKWREAK